jgi:hypothetical protein
MISMEIVVYWFSFYGLASLGDQFRGGEVRSIVAATMGAMVGFLVFALIGGGPL